MKPIFRIIWNLLALIGLITVLGGSAGLFLLVRSYHISPARIMAKAAEKAGIKNPPAVDRILVPKDRYAGQSFQGRMKTDRPRILYSDPAQGQAALERILNTPLSQPRAEGEYGNALDLALQYDLLFDHPALTPTQHQRIHILFRTYLQNALQVLDGNSASLWHGRFALFGDAGPRNDLNEETQRFIDLVLLGTGNPIFKHYSAYLDTRYKSSGYYYSYRWGIPVFRGLPENDFPDALVYTDLSFLENILPTSRIYGAYTSPHRLNYYIPTGSAVTSVEDWKNNLTSGLRFQGAKLLGFENSDPDYVYVGVDMTPAYATDKARKIIRELCYLVAEEALIVHDRVTTAGKAHAPKWLLHSWSKA